MKKLLAATALTLACAAAPHFARGRSSGDSFPRCADEYKSAAPDFDESDGCYANCSFVYAKNWMISFTNGHTRAISPYAFGQVRYFPNKRTVCRPQFGSVSFQDYGDSARWTQLTRDGNYFTSVNGDSGCGLTLEQEKWTYAHSCRGLDGGACTTPGIDGSCPPRTLPNGSGLCCLARAAEGCEELGLMWDEAGQVCRDLFGDGGGGGCLDPAPTYYCGDVIPEMNCPYHYMTDGICHSPVLVDVNGDGFSLTDAAGGVLFDLDGNPDAVKERLSWTAAGSDDAWLAIDRDGNGSIDSGRELFGNVTPQPPTTGAANGFNALSSFDRPARGGNSDGVIDERDAVFAHLRLWRDADHNGVSEPEELHTLGSLDVARLHFDHKESKKRDAHGNEFRYRAKVDDAKGVKAGRWAWDVFLVRAP